MELKLGVFRSLPITCEGKQNVSMIFLHMSNDCLDPHAWCGFSHMFNITQITVDTGNTHHGYFDQGQNPNTPILSPVQEIKWHWGLGSLVYISVVGGWATSVPYQNTLIYWNTVVLEEQHNPDNTLCSCHSHYGIKAWVAKHWNCAHLCLCYKFKTSMLSEQQLWRATQVSLFSKMTAAWIESIALVNSPYPMQCYRMIQ